MATITESSLPLSIESFSYSWLVNLKPSFNSLSDSFRAVLDASDEAFFIEMDPRMPPSKRFSPHHQDLNILEIDTPLTSPDELNSDELFSSSFTETTLSDPEEALQYSTSTTPTKQQSPSYNTKSRSALTRSTSLSKQIMGIYVEFLKPLYQKLRRCRSVSKLGADGSSRKSSPGTSPRSVVGSSPRSCYSECSIFEAVLHCKRTMH